MCVRGFVEGVIHVGILHFEVICSKTGIVDLEHETSVLCDLVEDLERRK